MTSHRFHPKDRKSHKRLSATKNSLGTIKSRYLLCTNIRLYVDSNGDRFTEATWRKDLSMQLRYVKDFVLACPVIFAAPPTDQVQLEDESIFRDMRIISLPVNNSITQECVHLPSTVAILWKAVMATEVVHAVLVGGLIPYGWITTMIAKLWFRNRFVIVIIESAPWRNKGRHVHSIARRVYSFISEFVNRRCVNASDLPIFTHEDYRSSLLTRADKRGHVIPASWIDDENIMSDSEAEQSWQSKLANPSGHMRIVFAARLIPEKGVLILLEALRLLARIPIFIDCDILGGGQLLVECEERIGQLPSTAKVRMLGTVSYDRQFFRLLRQYHAIVVPSLSDEQPRIIYDAFSQALPVLASSTPGTRSCITDHVNGKLVEPNSPQALADTLGWSSRNVCRLKAMGMAGLTTARAHTHWQMHERRWELLAEYLAIGKESLETE